MRLTQNLAPLFKEDPLVLVDVGAAGGLHSRWGAFGESLKAYCFDADKGECEKISDPRVTVIHQALGIGRGTATIYKTKHRPSSGMYHTKDEFFGRLLNARNAELVSTEEVVTISLEDARLQYGIPDPDFIKVDVEGAEVDILHGTDLGCVFGVLSEFRFHRAINGCAPFADLDGHMTQNGFMLYDLSIGRQSRKALPYKGEVRAWPDGTRRHGATCRGQVMDGDALYLRDPLLFKLSRNQILKAACLFELFDLKDCAAELLIERSKDADVDLRECLDLLAGVNYPDYMAAYA